MISSLTFCSSFLTSSRISWRGKNIWKWWGFPRCTVEAVALDEVLLKMFSRSSAINNVPVSFSPAQCRRLLRHHYRYQHRPQSSPCNTNVYLIQIYTHIHTHKLKHGKRRAWPATMKFPAIRCYGATRVKKQEPESEVSGNTGDKCRPNKGWPSSSICV